MPWNAPIQSGDCADSVTRCPSIWSVRKWSWNPRISRRVPRQQMVQWVAHIAFLLQPLYRLMFEEMKKGGYLQVDETPVKILDPEVKGKCARGYLWFYAVPGGDVYLDFQDTRGRKAPHAQPANFVGTIQTDAYEVYDSLKKVIANLVRIGCAAHSRRKFHRALKDGDRRAIWFIGQFCQLYRIERETKELTPENRHQIRQQRAAPIWELIRQKARELQPHILPQSSLWQGGELLHCSSAITGDEHHADRGTPSGPMEAQSRSESG